ncbi:hypothetical protein BH11PSE9_BH11PSE9_24310 [soil metagenome]
MIRIASLLAMICIAPAVMAVDASTAPEAPQALPSEGWTVIGRQGILLHVVVPTELARDRAAYRREIPAVCGEAETCFVNFYTNTTGAPLTMPVPDAIAKEPTAVMRRSAKQGVADGWRWSCRLAIPEPNCF